MSNGAQESLGEVIRLEMVEDLRSQGGFKLIANPVHSSGLVVFFFKWTVHCGCHEPKVISADIH